MKQPSWQQITDQRTKKKNRDLDAHTMGRDMSCLKARDMLFLMSCVISSYARVGMILESGEVLTHYHHMFNKTDTTCQQVNLGMVAYLGAV